MSRLWGFVPLACWLVQAIRYRDEPASLLWMCHVAALLLAIGLFARIVVVVRVAAVWSIVGVPLWLIDVVANGAHPASILSHIAVPVVAFFALRGMAGAHREPSSCVPIAVYAMTLFFVVQQVSRLVTAPALNINVAHAPYAVAMTYPAYWALTTIALAALLAAVAFASTKLPPLQAKAAARAKPANEREEFAPPPRSDPGFNVPPKMSPSEWRAAVAAGKASPIAVPLAEPPLPTSSPAPPPPSVSAQSDALPRTKTRGGLVVDRAKPQTTSVPDDLLPTKRR